MGSKCKNVWRFQAKQKALLGWTRQTRETHGPSKQQLNMAFVNSKNQNQQNLKKNNQIKLIVTLQD